MNRLTTFAAALFLTWFGAPCAHGQGRITYINAGIKLGYTFGQSGGFTYGLELSFTSTPFWDIDGVDKGLVYGVAVDLDFWKEHRRILIGAEVSTTTSDFFPFFPVGICIGPSLVTVNDASDVGVSFIPYIGAVGYPYYEYTFRPSAQDLHEIGVYLKGPIAISKH